MMMWTRWSRALRTSVEVPRPAKGAKCGHGVGHNCPIEEARRRWPRGREGERHARRGVAAAHARVEELEERLLCQQQVSSAARKASRSLKRAEAEAQDVLRKAAARRVVGALRRYEDGASMKSVRDVFVYWRRGTHAVASQSMEAKHAAACDALRKDLEAAHQRHAAAREEQAEAHDERLAFEASN